MDTLKWSGEETIKRQAAKNKGALAPGLVSGGLNDLNRDYGGMEDTPVLAQDGRIWAIPDYWSSAATSCHKNVRLPVGRTRCLSGVGHVWVAMPTRHYFERY